MSSRPRRTGELVPATEVAELTGRHVRTVRRMIERGELSGHIGEPYSNDDGRRRWYVHRCELRRVRGPR